MRRSGSGQPEVVKGESSEAGPSGFVIDALRELYAPPDAPGHPYYTLATASWARQWPVGEIWAVHLVD